MKTMEEKRAFAKRHLGVMVELERTRAAAMIASARKASALADFYEHRAECIDQVGDVTIDLMIADWDASLSVEANEQALTRARRAMFASIDGFMFPKTEEAT
jgi:hypothetical protein